MTAYVSIEWQRYLKWGVRLFIAFGVIVSFTTLSPMIAGPIAITLVAINYFLERIRFYTHVLHVVACPNDYICQNRLGSLWCIGAIKGEPFVQFGQLFRTKRAAKEAYQLFRCWNFGDYIDRNENVILSIVREELDRYTILLYPGERGVTEFIQNKFTEEHADTIKPIVHMLFPWFVTHADYWGRPDMKEIVDHLPDSPTVLLNCFFIQDGKPKPVAKRHLKLSRIVVVNRSDVVPGSPESLMAWKTPWFGMDRETREKYEPVFQDVNEGSRTKENS